jgi:predicted RNA binding protein YcfA (HicA-like mRNA interferase family)
MTYRQLVRKLRKLDCEFMRQSKGSHEIWTNRRNNRSAVVPNHPGDIPPGTLKAILTQLGIERNEFDAA